MGPPLKRMYIFLISLIQNQSYLRLVFQEQRQLQYHVNGYENLEADELTIVYSNGEAFSVYGFVISLERSFQSYFMRSYLPCMLFVVISWSSFVIDPQVTTNLWQKSFILILVFRLSREECPSW